MWSVHRASLLRSYTTIMRAARGHHNMARSRYGDAMDAYFARRYYEDAAKIRDDIIRGDRFWSREREC